MQYQMVVNEKGERLWLPIIAGAAILSAPFWLNNNRPNNNCCPPYYPPYYYPQPLPYPYPYPMPMPYRR
ncbi:MAG: hypothetical protein IJX78_07050 [Bacilli bacterium]|nr:hypothetical protein [Bacilli bacterium]